MKKIFLFFTLFLFSSCETAAQKELKKTLKSRAASERINASDSGNDKMLEELDE